MHSCFFSLFSAAAAAAAIAALLCAVLAASAHPTADGRIPGVAEGWPERRIERDAPAPVFEDSPHRFGLDSADDGNKFVLGMSPSAEEYADQQVQASNDGTFVGPVAKMQSQSFRPPQWLHVATQQQRSPVASPARPSFNNRGFYRASRRSRPDLLKRIVPRKHRWGSWKYL